MKLISNLNRVLHVSKKTEKDHKKGQQDMLGSILWAIVVILVILWLIGWLALHIGGGLIHILLVIAVIVILYNLFIGRRTRA
jgi:Flp pilus assembly protein TadB